MTRTYDKLVEQSDTLLDSGEDKSRLEIDFDNYHYFGMKNNEYDSGEKCLLLGIAVVQILLFTYLFV